MFKRLFLMVLCLLLIPMSWAGASVQEERKIQLGLNLFPNIISVDQQLLSKNSLNDKICLLLVYDQDKHAAESLVKQLSLRVKTIRKVKVEVLLVESRRINQQRYADAAGIFLVEKLASQQFMLLKGFAIKHHVVLFSPFSGDVERGASIGLSIGSKILPYYNADTLEKSAIVFHPLFLKVAKRYVE